MIQNVAWLSRFVGKCLYISVVSAISETGVTITIPTLKYILYKMDGLREID